MTSNRNQSSPDFPFVGVLEVVDVVGRAVDVAAEPQPLACCHESLGSASMAARSESAERHLSPLDANVKAESPVACLLASAKWPWPSRAGR